MLLIVFVGAVLSISISFATPFQEPTAFGVPLSQWVKDLESPDFNVRLAARKAIQSIGPPAALAAKDLIRTAEGMALLREFKAAAAPHLLRLLDEPQDKAVWQRASGLLKGMPAAEVIPLLLNDLATAPVPRQRALLEILGSFRHRARSAQDRIKPFLQSADAGCRLHAATALTRISPEANREALPVLQTFIEVMDLEHRDAAAEALCQALRSAAENGKWQQAEDDALSILYMLLESSRAEVRRPALETAGALGRVCTEPNADVTSAQLERLLPISERLVGMVARGLESEELEFRQQSAVALGNFGRLASPLVPNLVASLRQEPEMILPVLDTLRRLGPHAESAVDAVRRLTHHENQEIRAAAGAALVAITARVTLARDAHFGYTGFRSYNNVYVLNAATEHKVHQTLLRFKGRGDRGPDTFGTISISVDGRRWFDIGEWSRQSCELAAKADHWHELSLRRAPRDLVSKTLHVRFSYKRGAEQLNIYEVTWERR
jgi:hypothetical protein